MGGYLLSGHFTYGNSPSHHVFILAKFIIAMKPHHVLLKVSFSANSSCLSFLVGGLEHFFHSVGKNHPN